MSSSSAELRERGYIVRRGLFSPAEVETIREEALSLFRRQLTHLRIEGADGEPGMAALFRRHPEAFLGTAKLCQHLLSLHRLALNERLVALLRELGLSTPTLCTRPVLFFNSRNLAKEEVYYKTPPHQDWRSMQGSLDALVAWVPVAPIPPELGPPEVVPGSHRSGLYPASYVGWGFSKVEGFADCDFVPLETGPGDVVVFSAFLVHRSGDNRTDRVRWSAHFRYNNADDPSFIGRGYPCPYRYESRPLPET